jgi:hypothetical protein
MHPITSFVLFFLLISATLFGQSPDPRYPATGQIFPFGQVKTIDSKALGESRTINIYLPQDYSPDSAARYPVIYVLDGSAHEDFPHIAGLAQFMNMYDLLPKSIVVGIVNVDRYRDFTYPSKDPRDLEDMPTSGGSEKFIRFIATELQPMIAREYKTQPKRTLIGQSMGGLLATEILFKNAGLFEDYIIVSPSLWWDEQRMIDAREDYLKKLKGSKMRVYLCLGKEHPVMHEVADKLNASLKKTGIVTWYEPILTEDHATILHLAVYQAFKALNGG